MENEKHFEPAGYLGRELLKALSVGKCWISLSQALGPAGQGVVAGPAAAAECLAEDPGKGVVAAAAPPSAWKPPSLPVHLPASPLTTPGFPRERSGKRL